MVTTNGCFDLFHAGHLQTLTAARALGAGLIVLINSDASVKRLKGGQRPYLSEADRAALLRALRMVDQVVIFEQDTPLEVLEAIRPDVHAKGGSFVLERVQAEADLLQGWGGHLELLALRKGISSTALIHRIQADCPLEPDQD